ncbi:MAG: hypothetical protein KJO38_03785 [Gammaproteobacteria bacterium]|nr:hypothetical protein [Gammaproteobacteria bacterium]
MAAIDEVVAIADAPGVEAVFCRDRFVRVEGGTGETRPGREEAGLVVGKRRGEQADAVFFVDRPGGLDPDRGPGPEPAGSSRENLVPLASLGICTLFRACHRAPASTWMLKGRSSAAAADAATGSVSSSARAGLSNFKSIRCSL